MISSAWGAKRWFTVMFPHVGLGTVVQSVLNRHAVHSAGKGTPGFHAASSAANVLAGAFVVGFGAVPRSGRIDS
jgi:hypothetical protein